MNFRARFCILISSAWALANVSNARLLGIPTVPFTELANSSSYSFKSIKSIVVDLQFADAVNTDGETLIPPTLTEFASTFSEDIATNWGYNVSVVSGCSAVEGSIFLTIGADPEFVDVAGRFTGEAYSLNVTSTGITIIGASPLGAWWATRTLLQQAVLGDFEIPQGYGIDAPGWANRGLMMDVARHFYPKDFIIEMCSYLSFYKQNVYHLHLSDSLYNNVDIYTLERSKEIYAAFRLNSDDPAVAGLSNRPNESYYQADFEEIQQKCAIRGVTIIPELEAPGHAMVINQWKPELALNSDFSLLNISYPETIPTMELIWDTFLPWIHSKTVHIGADEYTSARDDYNTFVNTMADYIYNTSSKATRIWGTFPPIANESNIDEAVSIQHWEYFEDNPLTDYVAKNYSLLNSDDKFYIVAKWSGSYPQELNVTRIFKGQQDGGPYAPWVFDTNNATDNPEPDNPYVLGQLAALWNDYGPNATVVSEAYYSIRDGLPGLADKQWGGDLLEEEYYSILDALHDAIPAQNLDNAITSETDTILSYASAVGSQVVDLSGNGYHGIMSGGVKFLNSSFKFNGNGSITTPLVAKGRNYTLSFSVLPESDSPGTLFNSSISTLTSGNGTISNVTFISGGNAYSLNYTLPVGVWTDVSVAGIGNATFFTVGESGSETTMEFITKLGVNGAYFVWAPIAIEAPLTTIGNGFVGQIKNITLSGMNNRPFSKPAKTSSTQSLNDPSPVPQQRLLEVPKDLWT